MDIFGSKDVPNPNRIKVYIPVDDPVVDTEEKAVVASPKKASSSGGSTGRLVGGNSAGCKPVTLIFARGTWDLLGMGIIVGPEFASALKAKGVNVAVEPLNYPAKAGGISTAMTGTNPAIKTFVDAANQAVTKCPQTKLVLSGYSQGAMILHDALPKMSKETRAHTAAVVTFGDPFHDAFPADIKGKYKVFCKSDDPICEYIGTGKGSHLSYMSVAGDAASFVASKVKGRS
jgi:hypothetical protein